MEETSPEAHETSVSTEIYDGESLEVSTEDVKFIEKPQMEAASRIVWATPKTTTTESRRTTIAKETVTATMEVAPSKESSTTKWDLEVSEYGDSSRSSSTIDFHDEGESVCPARTLKNSFTDKYRIPRVV